MSSAYYTRLEQGHDRNASADVLDALARALRLDEDERAHLRRLGARRGAAPGAERLRPRLVQTVRALRDVPVLAIGRTTDVLAWNPLAHRLLAGHLPQDAPDRRSGRPNLARLVFLDPPTRRLYVDWERKARDAVAHLRLVGGCLPGDPTLAALVEELSAASPAFAALWSAHPVRDCAANGREYRHPVVGRLHLDDELLRVADDEGQRIAILSAEPGSASAERLRRLAAST